MNNSYNAIKRKEQKTMATTNFFMATNLLNIAAETIGPRVQVTELHSYLQEDQINIEVNYIHINKSGSIFNGVQELTFDSEVHFSNDQIKVSFQDSGVQEIELTHQNTVLSKDEEMLIVSLDTNRIPQGSIIIPELFSFSQLRKFFYIYDSITATSDNKIILYIDRYKSVIEGLNKKPKIKLRIFKPVITE